MLPHMRRETSRAKEERSRWNFELRNNGIIGLVIATPPKGVYLRELLCSNFEYLMGVANVITAFSRLLGGLSPENCIPLTKKLHLLRAFASLSLILLCCCPCFAIDRDVRIDQLIHTAWTAANGAPTYVNALSQTTDGVLWLGTNSGLYRFDGVSFSRFSLPAERLLAQESTKQDAISSLTADPEGSLWVGFSHFGRIIRIKDGALVSYTVGDGALDTAIRSIVRDPQGVMWAAGSAGLMRLEGSRWERIGSGWNLEGVSFSSAYVDRQGQLWVAANDKLFVLKLGQRRFTLAANGVHVSGIGESTKGDLWVTELGRPGVRLAPLLWLRATNLTTEVRVGSLSFLFDDQGSLWIPTYGDGLRRVSNPYGEKKRIIGQFSNRAEIFTQKDGLSSNVGSKILQDREGNIWVASRGGLDRFRQAAVITTPSSPGSWDDSLAREPNGKMWIGSVVHPLPDTADPDFRSLPHRECAGAYSGPNYSIWINCSTGLYHLADHHIVSFKGPLKENNPAYAITEDHDGALWVSLKTEGVFRLLRGKWSMYERWNGEAHAVRAAYTDDLGRVWFGYRDGVVRIEDHGQTARTFEASNVDLGSVSVIQNRGSEIWVGGSRGIALWDGNGFHKIVPLNAEAFSEVRGFVLTKNDGIWIPGGSELLHIAQNETDMFRRDHSHQVTFRTYGIRDGLTSSFEYHQAGNPSAVEGTDGRLWFATADGVVWIDPKHIPRNTIPPTVSIEAMYVNGRTVSSPAPVTFPAHTSSLKLGYTAWSLSIPERVRFRYRLEGLEQDWQDAGTNREAAYTNLAPGSYKFHVIARNEDGLWSPVDASRAFTILPAYYQTIWFRCLMLALFLLALWTAIRWRLRSATAKLEAVLSERHAERLRIARELHDTLIQGYQAMVFNFQTVADMLPVDVNIRRTLERVLDQADETLVEGRQRVRDLRAVELAEGALLDYVKKTADDLQKDTDTKFQLQTAGTMLKLSSDVGEELFAIAKEAMTNAFRHADASLIELHLAYGKFHFKLVCRDNGKGISPDVLKNHGREGHWGIVGMEERARKIGGSTKLESSRSVGTRFELRLPARIAYRRRRS